MTFNRSHHGRWSFDWNLTIWVLALVVTLTILIMHLTSQMHAPSPPEEAVRTSVTANP